jgi:hypothetical protein
LFSASSVVAVVASSPALAQANPAAASGGGAEPETLVGDPDSHSVQVSGWFLAPTFATTSFADTLAYEPGLRGGIYLNRRFAVGVAVNGMYVADSSFSRHEIRDTGLYGGLLLQYIVHANRLLHVSAETTLGNGCTRRA